MQFLHHFCLIINRQRHYKQLQDNDYSTRFKCNICQFFSQTPLDWKSKILLSYLSKLNAFFSQIDTLRLAIAYISLLREVLHSELEPVVYIEQSLRGELRTPGSLQWNTSDLTARLAWINWDNLGISLARNSFIGGGGGMPSQD